MYLYRTGSQPSKASRIVRGAICASLSATVVFGGCAKYAEPLELNPGAWAPQAVQREWAPAPGQHGLVGSAAEAAALSDQPPAGRRMELTDLIGYALANNPSTRSTHGVRPKRRQQPLAKRVLLIIRSSVRRATTGISGSSIRSEPLGDSQNLAKQKHPVARLRPDRFRTARRRRQLRVERTRRR